MKIRVVDGRRMTDRAGAAEFTGRSEHTITIQTSPKRRAEGSRWPAPVPGPEGVLLYPLDDLAAAIEEIAEASRARVHSITLDGDPDELIPALEFRTLIDAKASTWSKYVDMSKAAWERGEDGYLPRPDLEEPAPKRGIIRSWRRQRVEQWINSRPGRGAGAGPPVRTEEAGPTAAKYRRVMAAIRKDISEGTFTPGQPLPSEAKLGTRYAVSLTTVRRSLTELHHEGVLIRSSDRTMVAPDTPPHDG
ncbi:winged helix-turn-helix domain-containing protein [Micromonospora sp. NPDC049257]|uniref:winged helix-turn-helix domain-containing protein n=1 Tax=Micromonospora sp. NPDC049257 TaxID=3155771 RepID=UPI00342EC460